MGSWERLKIFQQLNPIRDPTLECSATDHWLKVKNLEAESRQLLCCSLIGWVLERLFDCAALFKASIWLLGCQVKQPTRVVVKCSWRLSDSRCLHTGRIVTGWSHGAPFSRSYVMYFYTRLLNSFNSIGNVVEIGTALYEMPYRFNKFNL